MPILCGSQDQCTSDRIRLLAVHDVRDVLAQFERTSHRTAQNRHVVACTWSELPDLPGLIDDVIQRMGETAGRLWPHWYGVTLPRNDNIDKLLAAVSHSPLYRDGIGSALMAPWLQAAATRCESVRLPLPAGFSKAAHLRQLALGGRTEWARVSAVHRLDFISSQVALWTGTRSGMDCAGNRR